MSIIWIRPHYSKFQATALVMGGLVSSPTRRIIGPCRASSRVVPCLADDKAAKSRSSGSLNAKEVKSALDLANLPHVPSEPTTTTSPPAVRIERPTLTWSGLKPSEVGVMLAVAALVLLASYRGWWTIGVTEAWGFATGGVCVWLVVREHLWNWPIGLANNVFFFVLFLQGRLFADMGLQVVYFGLGVFGWLNWVFGGENKTALKISRTPRTEWLVLLVAIPLVTWALREILIAVNGAAPFWDSLTTVLSLAAQYLLCRKRFENWFFWIAADVIYIPLYVSRDLPLTAVLYGVFLGMCLVGVLEWSRSLRKGKGVTAL
jgi:nicotinamide mononucleotide transporter